MNPLLDFSALPRFEEIRPSHVTPAINQLLGENRALIHSLAHETASPNWENFVQPMEDANERLARAWSQVAHLNEVMNEAILREVYNENLPKLTAYYSELAQNLQLFDKLKAIRTRADFATLSAAQQKIIDNALRDFRLGGAELDEQSKTRFKAIQEELSSLSAKFSEHVLDATDAFAHYVQAKEDLAGVPEDVLAVASQAAAAEGKSGWKLTLHAPCYLPLMQYADNRALRELLYHAYVTRASEFGNPLWDNAELIKKLMALRLEEAQLLGFDNYAELSLQTKMAESPASVLAFLRDLGEKAKPYAKRDLQELKEFAKEELHLEHPEVWDYAYVSEKLRIARYAFSDQEVKQYFPEERVLSGMFKVIETIYGVFIEAATAPVWHKDVKFFSIKDHGGQVLGQFYVDLYARANKRGGAWMDDAISRRRKNQEIQTPVAYLTCNFSGPVDGKPALFTHDEVITLFHEFGHGLHHLLSRVDYLGVSGIRGVEWDAVELPSQFMENFAWEWQVLKHLSRHVDSGEPLPQSLFSKMQSAKNFQIGIQTLRQLEFSLFDMHLHYDFDIQGDKTVLQLLQEIRSEVALMPAPEYNRFPNSFSHIFAGGYAAGYYSYKWAEVLSADAYSLFEANGVLSPAIGQRFWDEVLSVGGSRPALESFIAFRGRAPDIAALLQQSGMH